MSFPLLQFNRKTENNELGYRKGDEAKRSKLNLDQNQKQRTSNPL